MNIVEIISRITPKVSSKKSVTLKRIPVKIATFTIEQQRKIIWHALYTSDKIWWRLWLLLNHPNVEKMALRLGMQFLVLEKEYQMFLNDEIKKSSLFG